MITADNVTDEQIRELQRSTRALLPRTKVWPAALDDLISSPLLPTGALQGCVVSAKR